jgi:hypothetical protein
MNDRERREYEMFLRALLFLTANSGDFASIPAVAEAIAILQSETATLAELGADKVSATSGAKDATIHKGDLRDALLDAIQDIADMWKPMAKNHDNAENKFRIIYGSDQLLIDTAGSFIEDATAIKADFIARGMSPDFINDLTAKRDAFAEVVNESSVARMERVGINAALREPIKKCRAAVQDVDPIVKMVYRTNAAKRAEWLTASHVERA